MNKKSPLNYHKGQKCILSSIYCQEGYCEDCIIQKEKIENENKQFYPKIITTPRN